MNHCASFQNPVLMRGMLVTLLFAMIASLGPGLAQGQDSPVQVTRLPELPDDIGVAGPLVGLHNDVLIAAGGANFSHADDPDLFELPKRYHDRIWVMTQESNGRRQWKLQDNRLLEPVGYSSVVTTPFGVLCLGGENESGPTRRAFLLRWNGTQVEIDDSGVPDLPVPCTAGGAALVDGMVYAIASDVDSADGVVDPFKPIWRMPVAALDPDQPAMDASWQPVPAWPDLSPPKQFPLITAQHDGFGERLYVLGGRYPVPVGEAETLVFHKDCWVFDPTLFDPDKLDPQTGSYLGNSPWKQIADAPVPLSAGTAVPFGPAHIIVPAYATGEVLAEWQKSGMPMSAFDHPGFPREILAYHTVTDTWTTLGQMPAGQVTTPAVVWNDEIIIVSGEIRPRVRSNQVWSIRIEETTAAFGFINMLVVVFYLLGMLAIGCWFAKRNKSTDDYFRGGKHIPWWVAGCSIFATMLSSITFMAIPAKAFAQDWVYAAGSILILAVAPIAIYVALPFFRGIDATSAYEYLELRFNRIVRLIGSGSFSLFHVFRMGVVLALAALALSTITPLSASQCVLVMGVLSIIYCTLGGIEAVVWTDTVQTFVLLGGAVLCIVFALLGSNEGSFDQAINHGKLHLVNLDFGSQSFTTMAIWVVILGGFGQNLASYTADQTVIQRYMTTENRRSAARSIWLNGLMAIPTAILFFGLGTAFWMFYQSHPEKLDPTMSADSIMPLFISHELPVVLAGLVVAGIFAAAQSTVSTSMNSGATTIVTDFMRPFRCCQSERAYLRAARIVTLFMGMAGTFAGLLFVDPSIKSLFDEFIGILGMFLGVLAGLFALGVTTRRANTTGSLIGAACSIFLMLGIVSAANHRVIAGVDFRALFDSLGIPLYRAHSYLYAIIGIATCYAIGYMASAITRGSSKALDGLTLWDRREVDSDADAGVA